MTSLHDFFYITFWHDSAPYCILLISIRQCLLCSLIGAISVWAYPENSLRHLFNSSALLSTFSLSLVTFKTPWATTLCWCWLVSLSGLTVWSTSHQLWTQSEFGKCVYLINSYFFQGWVFFSQNTWIEQTESIPLIDAVCSLQFHSPDYTEVYSKNKLRCILMRWIL